MKIYTKTGDDGTTGLFGGARVDKDDLRVEAFGSIDETNALIGRARAANPPKRIDRVLELVQSDLFVLGAELACVAGKEDKLGMPLISGEDVARLEQTIDQCETSLTPLDNFILPVGTAAASALHHARTVCRRAERRVLSAGRVTHVRADLGAYLNRLSDLLFVLARACNHEAGVADVPWSARQPKTASQRRPT